MVLCISCYLCGCLAFPLILWGSGAVWLLWIRFAVDELILNLAYECWGGAGFSFNLVGITLIDLSI